MSALADLLPGMDLRREAATNGGEYSGPCPRCGGHDRWRVWPHADGGRLRFWCRGCDWKGDALDLEHELTGKPLGELLRDAGVERRTTALTVPRARERAAEPPQAAWQARAEQVAQEAERALWTPAGALARTYLNRRGLPGETLKVARLGFVAADLREPGAAWGLPADRAVWVPRGVAIPWRLAGGLWRLNVRRAAGEPKYVGPAGGSGSGLYLGDRLRAGAPALVCEGELDCLSAAQQMQDVVRCVATGSTCGARRDQWVRVLRRCSVVLLGQDADDAGEQAARWWCERLPNARRLLPPGGCHDLNTALQAGHDLRTWVLAALERP